MTDEEVYTMRLVKMHEILNKSVLYEVVIRDIYDRFGLDTDDYLKTIKETRVDYIDLEAWGVSTLIEKLDKHRRELMINGIHSVEESKIILVELCSRFNLDENEELSKVSNDIDTSRYFADCDYKLIEAYHLSQKRDNTIDKLVEGDDSV